MSTDTPIEQLGRPTPPVNVYRNKCRIILWVDADTLELHPLITPPGVNIRVRLKDRWEPEVHDDGHDLALDKAKLELGWEMAHVIITNTVHDYDQGRLIARVDRPDAGV